MAMKMEEIQALTVEELARRGKELRAEGFNLRLQQAGGQLEKPSRLREIRRTVARMETVLNQKRRAAAPARAAGKQG